MRLALAIVASLVGCDHGRARSPATSTPPPPISPPVAAAAPPPATVLRPRDVIEHPAWIGQTVTVDVFEPLNRESDQPLVIGVFVADVVATHFHLVEGYDDKANTLLLQRLATNRPVRVHGEIRRAGDGFAIAVDHSEDAPLPTPVKLASVAELVRDPARFTDAYVEVEATWTAGHEISTLDDAVWLEDMLARPTVHCGPAVENKRGPTVVRHRIRVVGFAHTRGGYGHVHAWAIEIAPMDVTFIDPKNSGHCEPDLPASR